MPLVILSYRSCSRREWRDECCTYKKTSDEDIEENIVINNSYEVVTTLEQLWSRWSLTVGRSFVSTDVLSRELEVEHALVLGGLDVGEGTLEALLAEEGDVGGVLVEVVHYGEGRDVLGVVVA